MGAIQTRFDQATKGGLDETQLLSYQLCTDTETLRVYMNSEFDTHSSRRLLTTLHLVAESFDYRTVEIQITSPGGDGIAMHICLHTLDGMRKDLNIQFHTIGVSMICSAAANLLAYGDLGQRSAILGSRLVFHTCRLGFQGPITSTVAQGMWKYLDEADQEVLRKLAVHIAPCFYSEGEGIYAFPRSPVTEKPFQGVIRSRRLKDRDAFIRYLQKQLEKVFRLDSSMTVQTAIALGLCDVEKTHLLKLGAAD
jgi:ATP-dependent protease ClpP protease subunit